MAIDLHAHWTPRTSTPEEFTERVKRDTVRLGKLIMDLGIPLQ